MRELYGRRLGGGQIEPRSAERGEEEGTRDNLAYFLTWPTWQRRSLHPPPAQPQVPLCLPSDCALPPSPRQPRSPCFSPPRRKLLLLAGLKQVRSQKTWRQLGTPPKELETALKHLYTLVHSNIIYSSQKAETTQVSIN